MKNRFSSNPSTLEFDVVNTVNASLWPSSAYALALALLLLGVTACDTTGPEDRPAGNEAPAAQFTLSTDSTENLRAQLDEVVFDASASSDADGRIEIYEWDFDSDNVVDASGAEAEWTFKKAGRALVSLTVTDEHGVASEATKAVAVADPRKGVPFSESDVSFFKDAVDHFEVRKWNTDLYVSVTGSPKDRSIEDYKRALRIGAYYAKIDVHYVDSDHPELNVEIHYMSNEKVKNRFGGDWGHAFYRENEQGLMEGAEVFISRASDVRQIQTTSLTYHEIGHVLGFNHAESGRESVMVAPSYDYLEYQEIDLRGLEMIYHPDIRAGMKASEAARVLRGLQE